MEEKAANRVNQADNWKKLRLRANSEPGPGPRKPKPTWNKNIPRKARQNKKAYYQRLQALMFCDDWE